MQFSQNHVIDLDFEAIFSHSPSFIQKSDFLQYISYSV